MSEIDWICQNCGKVYGGFATINAKNICQRCTWVRSISTGTK